jgi:polysaccharide pyruvyl transferase WcaK-like protein
VILYGTTQWADRVPARDIVDGLGGLFGPDVLERVTTPEVHTLEDLWTVLSAVDWVVASRYHGVATALLMRKPVVGIAYEQKTSDLMANLGLGDYSIPIDEIDGTSLAALLDDVQRNDAAIREALDARARTGQAAVHAQYEQVLEKYTPEHVET